MKYTKIADNENFDIENPFNIWTIDMFTDNTDSPDGNDTEEFTKSDLIDFLNERIEDYNSTNDSDFPYVSENASNSEVEEAVYDLLEGKVVSIEPYYHKRLSLTARECYHALHNHTITKEDGEIFNKVLEKALENSEYAYDLLRDKIITKSDDGEIFKEAVEKALERPDYAYSLLYRKIVTMSDEELFKKAVKKAIEDSWQARSLLNAKIITRSDGEIFDEVVEKALGKALEDSDYAYKLLNNKEITGEWEIFDKVVERAIENSGNAYRLILNKRITKEDGDIFKKAVEKALEEDSSQIYSLLYYKIITKENVPSELWEKVLSSAEKLSPSIRQMFGSINFRRNSSMRFYKTAGWRVEKVNENDWIIHTPKGYYVDENDKEYHFSTKEKALAELDYLRAEHKYEKKSELGFNANPENEEEERVLEIANELENACFNAYKENKWNGWSTLEERQRGIDLAKKALAPLVEKYDKELSDDRFFKMLYRHNEDNNYHTENKALEELTGRKRRASMNRKAYYDEYLEDLNSPEYIYSLLLNGNIAEYKKALNDMTKKELVQYLRWADEMGIDDSKLNLHYITASKKVTAENEFEKAFENDLIIDDENDNAWFPGYEEYKFKIEPSYEKMKEKALKIWKQIHSSKKVTAEKYNPIVRKKFAGRGYILRKSYKNNEIVPGVKHIWHGEWSDPEIEYNGYLFNYWDVLDALESWYNEICENNNEKPTDDGLDTFIKNNIKDELDDYINIGGIGKKIESSNNKRSNMKYYNNTSKKIAMRMPGKKYHIDIDTIFDEFVGEGKGTDIGDYKVINDKLIIKHDDYGTKTVSLNDCEKAFGLVNGYWKYDGNGDVIEFGGTYQQEDMEEKEASCKKSAKRTMPLRLRKKIARNHGGSKPFSKHSWIEDDDSPFERALRKRFPYYDDDYQERDEEREIDEKIKDEYTVSEKTKQYYMENGGVIKDSPEYYEFRNADYILIPSRTDKDKYLVVEMEMKKPFTAMRRKAGESYDDEEYTVSAETIQYYKENGGVLKGTPEYNEFFNAGYTMKQSLTDKDKYYVVEMERMRPFTARRKKAGESYGWVVDSADAYDALDKFVDAYGTEEALDAITRAMSNDDLSDTLAYIFREYDFKEGCSDYEYDEEEEYEKDEEYEEEKEEE